MSGSPGVSLNADTNDSTARFYQPSDVAVDDLKNVYVTDTFNCTIRKVTRAGVVTTVAGAAGIALYNDGTGSGAYFFHPSSIAVDGMRNLYVIDDDLTVIRKITPDGVVTTLAGHSGFSGAGDGNGTSAFFNDARGLCIDPSGNIYVADTGNFTIRKITPSGVVTTLAGQPGSYGSTDGVGSAARFTNPRDVATDSLGNVYVTDSGNNTIRKITPAGAVTTLASSTLGADTDGTGGVARFNNPYCIAKGADDSFYVLEGGNQRIRKVTAAGVVTTIKDFTGVLFHPYGLSGDDSGNFYFADGSANDIVKLTPSGSMTVLAGSPDASGSVDGSNSATPAFFNPISIAVGRSGNVYVCDDSGSKALRKISATGVVSTLAVLGSVVSSARGVAVDSLENVYFADFVRSEILKLRLTERSPCLPVPPIQPAPLMALVMPRDSTARPPSRWIGTIISLLPIPIRARSARSHPRETSQRCWRITEFNSRWESPSTALAIYSLPTATTPFVS